MAYSTYSDSETIPDINHFIEWVDAEKFRIISQLCDIQIGDGFEDDGTKYYQLNDTGMNKFRKARDVTHQKNRKTIQGIPSNITDDFTGYRYEP